MVAKSKSKRIKTLRTKALSARKEKDVRGGAYDAFLKLDGIKGESQESTHKDWIEILSYNH